MGRLLRAVVVVAVMVALAGACANTPDTTLHTDPPAVTYAPLQHPFHGARLFVDDQTPGARWQREHGARWLDPITTRPQARWLNGPQDLARLPALAARARRQQALLVLVTYYLPNRGCSPSSDQGAPTSRHYRRWIDRLIHRLGSTRAAIVVEPDAVAADCFDTARATLLKHSVKRLANAGQYVYLDAGHARWRSTGEMSERLLRAGIQYAQGFAVNVANRQTTRQSYRWGRELSDLLGRVACSTIFHRPCSSSVWRRCSRSDRTVDRNSAKPRCVISKTARVSTKNSDAAWAMCSSSWELLWVLRTSSRTVWWMRARSRTLSCSLIALRPSS
jgi:endoglucanase